MRLYQPEAGYCYNSDSILLYDFINGFAPRGRLLDVGAGCGVIGLLVARDNDKIELFGVEKQDVFINYIQKNAAENGIEYGLYHMDFLDLDENLQFDYIVSNPPFYHDGASRSQDSMLYNARYSINLPVKDFFKKAAQLLSPKGHFIFCYDAKQFALVCAALEEVRLRVVDVRFVHSKNDRNASLVMLHVRKNSKSLLNILPPFISFGEDKVSKELEAIYKKANTDSVKCQI